MNAARVLVAIALFAVLGVPFALRPADAAARAGEDVPTVVVITPHVSQIEIEFGRGFERWHERVYGTPMRVTWLGPLGTSDILKLLQAKYNAAIRSGDITPDGSCLPGTIPIDAMFGGGTYDHGRLKAGEGVPSGQSGPGGKAGTVPMSVPAGFTQAQLDEWFGENIVGVGQWYDPQQYWIGNALSGFGIVYNKQILGELGVPSIESFEDLCRPELRGWVALADPRQSGSLLTSLDAILSYYGWEKGWRVLREMGANTRYFTNASTKPPVDVGQGEAAAGLAIDFYGRNQAQSILAPGQDPATSRVGYVDPKGSTYIDADPVSILRGGPNPQGAKRFVEFLLTEEAQAYWQFHPTSTPAGANNPPGPDGRPMGPETYPLRRMPIRRVMYEKYRDYFIDAVDPFESATKTKPAGWRGSIAVMMGAFCIDTASEAREAWGVLSEARKDRSFPPGVLAEMEESFYAFPAQELPDGGTLDFTPGNCKPITDAWKDKPTLARSKIAFTRFFRGQYARVIELAEHARNR